MANQCFQSRQVTGKCDICDQSVELMHLPVRPLGFYCAEHCPVCAGSARMRHADFHSETVGSALAIRIPVPFLDQVESASR
jgi:hypothetical protein